jgi:hypothetical protein
MPFEGPYITDIGDNFESVAKSVNAPNEQGEIAFYLNPKYDLNLELRYEGEGVSWPANEEFKISIYKTTYIGDIDNSWTPSILVYSSTEPGPFSSISKFIRFKIPKNSNPLPVNIGTSPKCSDAASKGHEFYFLKVEAKNKYKFKHTTPPAGTTAQNSKYYFCLFAPSEGIYDEVAGFIFFVDKSMTLYTTIHFFPENEQ